MVWLGGVGFCLWLVGLQYRLGYGYYGRVFVLLFWFEFPVVVGWFCLGGLFDLRITFRFLVWLLAYWFVGLFGFTFV